MTKDPKMYRVKKIFIIVKNYEQHATKTLNSFNICNLITGERQGGKMGKRWKAENKIMTPAYVTNHFK